MMMGTAAETAAAAANVICPGSSPGSVLRDSHRQRPIGLGEDTHQQKIAVGQQQGEKGGGDMIPGHMMGMMTLMKAVSRLAPSTIADSSISLGIFMKKLRSIQMVKG